MLNERDIPKTPIIKGKNYYCPSCDHWILWLDAIPLETDNYCSKCGQAINWEDEEDR